MIVSKEENLRIKKLISKLIESDNDDIVDFIETYVGTLSGRANLVDYLIQNYNFNIWDFIDDYALKNEIYNRQLNDEFTEDIDLTCWSDEAIIRYLQNRGFCILDDRFEDDLYFAAMEINPGEPKTKIEEIVFKYMEIYR